VTGCAVEPTGDWIGTASRRTGGSTGGEVIGADARWTRVANEGCVDLFVPTGTASIVRSGSGCTAWQFEPPSVALAATDGELVIDRSTWPPRYRLYGETVWDGRGGCAGATSPMSIGDVWAWSEGAFDGAVIAGSSHVLPSYELRWDLRRADVVFAPGKACAEPPAERWHTTTHVVDAHGLRSDVTWTRASTEGCVDRYVPSGIAEVVLAPPAGCSHAAVTPSSRTIGPHDGVLVIDRGTSPPTFFFAGDTAWDATLHCAWADGRSTRAPLAAGGVWASVDGAIDGRHQRATYRRWAAWESWSLTRAP
jgi:hypothetical protein